MSITEIRVPEMGDFKDVAVIEVHIKPGDEIAAEHIDSIVIRKVDVDQVPDLVVRFGIASAPTKHRAAIWTRSSA